MCDTMSTSIISYISTMSEDIDQVSYNDLFFTYPFQDDNFSEDDDSDIKIDRSDRFLHEELMRTFFTSTKDNFYYKNEISSDVDPVAKVCDDDFSQSLQIAETQIIGFQQADNHPWMFVVDDSSVLEEDLILSEVIIPPMIQAAAGGQKDLVKFLLSQGVDADVADTGGRTALFIASALGYTDIIDALIQSGANINVQTHNGITPLMVAIRSDCPTTVETLLGYSSLDITIAENKSGYTALMMAISNSSQDIIIDMLIQKRSDLNAQDCAGLTALMHATIKERADIVSLLLKNGAACDVQDFEGKTALHYAAEKGCLKVVMDLLKSNADPNKQDHKGYTPLMYSLENDQVLTSYRILQGPHHVDLLPRSTLGQSALIIAAQKRQRHIFAEILRRSIPTDFSTFRKARNLLLLE